MKKYKLVSLLAICLPLMLVSCQVYDGKESGDPFSASLQSLSDAVLNQGVIAQCEMLQYTVEIQSYLSLTDEEKFATRYDNFRAGLTHGSSGYILDAGVGYVFAESEDGSWKVTPNDAESAVTLVQESASAWSATSEIKVNDITVSVVTEFALHDSEASPWSAVWDISVRECTYNEPSRYEATFYSESLRCAVSQKDIPFTLPPSFSVSGRFVMDVSRDGRILDRLYTLFNGKDFSYRNYLRVPMGE